MKDDDGVIYEMCFFTIILLSLKDHLKSKFTELYHYLVSDVSRIYEDVFVVHYIILFYINFVVLFILNSGSF